MANKSKKGNNANAKPAAKLTNHDINYLVKHTKFNGPHIK